VVEDEIDDDPQAALPRRGGEVREVAERPAARIDGVVIAHV